MKKGSLFVLLLISFLCVKAQNVGIGTVQPNGSAILDVTSTSQGILIPRMTEAQRILIPLPAQGLMVYQTDIDTGFYFFKGTAWKNLTNNNSNAINSTKILYRKITPSRTIELWSINLDGTNKKKVNIMLPTGWELEWEEMAKVTANGQNIIILAINTLTRQEAIYICNIDGSNVVKLTDEPIDEDMAIQSLY